MKNYLTSSIDKLTRNKFKKICITICFLGDLLFAIFFRFTVLSKKNIRSVFVDQLGEDKIEAVLLQKDITFFQLADMLRTQATNLIIGYLLITIIAYYLFYKDNKFGIGFIKSGTVILGIIFGLLSLSFAFKYSVIWGIVFILLLFGYIYLFFGLRKFYKN